LQPGDLRVFEAVPCPLPLSWLPINCIVFTVRGYGITLLAGSAKSKGGLDPRGLLMTEGSLEVKLPTIWTDERQSRAEAERRERLEERRVEEKESEERRCRCAKR